MKAIKKMLLILLIATTLWAMFNISIHSNSQNLEFIIKSVKADNDIVTKVLELDKANDVYNWALTAFETENYEQITIDSSIEKTTLADLMLNKRRFDLILNENKHAEYLLTIIVEENLSYIISDFSLRIE